MEDDIEILYSPRCRRIDRDGRSVQVQIYRGTDETEGWILEVEDLDTGSSILWDDPFRTDGEALEHLLAEIDAAGLDRVIDEAPEARFPSGLGES